MYLGFCIPGDCLILKGWLAGAVAREVYLVFGPVYFVFCILYFVFCIWCLVFGIQDDSFVRLVNFEGLAGWGGGKRGGQRKVGKLLMYFLF